MEIRTYLLYALVTATANAATSIQLPRSGTIRSLQFNQALDTVASFRCTLQVAVNRATGMFGASQATPCDILGMACVVTSQSTAAALVSGSRNDQIACNRKVGPNDTVYLHASCQGTGNNYVHVVVVVEE